MSAGESDPETITFAADVIHWRGPSPFFFVAVPKRHVAGLARAARAVSYGWGMIPVEASIGAVAFSTSLFPKDGGYLLPLRVTVRRAAGIAMGDRVTVELQIARAG